MISKLGIGEAAPGDTSDVLSMLRGLLADDSETPGHKANATMDAAMKNLLEFYKGNREALTSGEYKLSDPMVADAFLENLAAKMMFKLDPRDIAYAAALAVHRYAGLLETWAPQYLAAAKGEDEMDLDAATTPEAKLAVTDAVNADVPPAHKTGMYL